MKNELLYNTDRDSSIKNDFLHTSSFNTELITALEKPLLHSTDPELSEESALKSELFYNTFKDELDYRGIHVDFYSDSGYLQVIAEFSGEKVPLGYGNYDYKSEIRKIIDLQLDTICQFEGLTPYARLQFFNNYTNKDIKLVYRGRILKIYPVFDENSLNMSEIKKDSEKCLKKVLKLEKFQDSLKNILQN